ncbi:NAD(P)-binding protein [Delitschia confertaspora ATCC 74209]|uniref:NAD(P)-binding protein n=1 Tax=Delitschia confertaspora ATCC 74209 TaxID=1513339 RepID=A0A9P4MQK3_9PLEO|nr:NAD(P)-binding protein [Delitschia confertaspora ATCC 74209]
MDYIKNTIAENLGKLIPGNEQANPDSQFSLSSVPDQSGKVAVVTGGTEGIGYGCTHSLLSKNISRVFILSKSPEIAEGAIKSLREDLGEEAAKKIQWMQCDLSDWEQTSKVAFDIAKKTDRIHILMNIAGRGIMTQQFVNGIDLNMAINHIGHTVLTSHLLPLLKETAKTEKVRIVNMSSNAHEQAPKDTKFNSPDDINKDSGPMGIYGRSKLATLLYSKYLAKHLTASHPNILINATHPGFVETRQSVEHIHEPYPIAGYGVSHLLAPFKKDQFEGAVSAMFAATQTDKSGQYICPPAIVEKGSSLANDEQLGEDLMSLTWKIVREKTQSESADKGCPFKEY